MIVSRVARYYICKRTKLDRRLTGNKLSPYCNIISISLAVMG